MSKYEEVKNDEKVILLIIDPQNDFHPPSGSLAVTFSFLLHYSSLISYDMTQVPGADADSGRISKMIRSSRKLN